MIATVSIQEPVSLTTLSQDVIGVHANHTYRIFYSGRFFGNLPQPLLDVEFIVQIEYGDDNVDTVSDPARSGHAGQQRRTTTDPIPRRTRTSRPITNEEWALDALMYCKKTIANIIYSRALDQTEMYLAANLIDAIGDLPETPERRT